MIGFNDMKFESWHCRWWILGISQDQGCWDPGPFGPGICMAGPVMVNHPEKVEESLANVRFVNQQDYNA